MNAGSNDVSLFRVHPKGLRLSAVTSSGGMMPVSVAVHRDLVYVLNAGSGASPANVSGFAITPRGGLVPLAGSTRPLGSDLPAPAQVGITPDGDALVVTEKATNRVLTYTLDENGYPDGPNAFASPGLTPFGFAFDSSGHLFVTEAFPGMEGASATTAFGVEEDGDLSVIDASVPTHQTAACWAVVTPNDKYLYVTNFASDSISGYSIDRDGSISLLDADGLTAATGTGSGPLDMAISGNGRFLYVLLAGTNSIGAYRIHNDGSLTPVGDLNGLPAGLNGLAAW